MIIYIRVDADNQIGKGHLMRCIAMGEALLELGHDVQFLTNTRQVELNVRGLNYHIIGHLINKGPLVWAEELVESESAIVVVDSYSVDEYYFLSLKTHFKKIVYVDDLYVDSKAIDLIINGNAYADINEYVVKNVNKYALGSDYTIIRNEFILCKQANDLVDKRRVLMTFGGTDPHKLTLKFLKAFREDKAKQDIELHVIVGSGFEEKSSFEEYNEPGIVLYYGPENIAKIMSKCNIAITSSGSTMYELAYLGIPSISVIVAKNQRMLNSLMVNYGITKSVGESDKFNYHEVNKWVEVLLNDRKIATDMSNKGMALIDGKGATKCAKRIIE